MRARPFALALLPAVCLASASYLARVEVHPSQRLAAVAERLPVYKDLGDGLLLPLSPESLSALRARNWHVELLDQALSPGDYFLVHKTGFPVSGVQGSDFDAADPTFGGAARVLWQDDRFWLVRLPESRAQAVKAAGFRLVQLPLAPHPLPSPSALRLSPRSSYDTTVAHIVSLVSPESLVRTIRDLESFGTRYSYYPQCESAAYYLRDRLSGLGYSVRLDTYYLRQPTTRVFNLEATLAGRVAPESMVVVCAHFDTYNQSNQRDAPGADDNATGAAAVLELARVLRSVQFRWSVKFLLFSGEEQWMKGSYHWVDSTARPQNLKLPGVYNLDMFGYAAYDTNLVFVNTNARSRPLADLCDSVNLRYALGLRVMNYLDEDIYGDNTPFWEAGYPCVFALEDSQWGIWNGSNPYYHTAGDTFGHLIGSLVTRTTKMTAACLATLATPLDSVGIAEGAGPRAASVKPGATVARNVLRLTDGPSRLFDASGRKVLELQPGANDVSHLVPGVYFLQAASAAAGARAATKVVLAR